MSYWNGTRWIPDAPQRPPKARRAQRAADWLATLLMLVLMPALVVAMASAVAAGKPGTGATLSVTPNAAAAWSSATATGCGYGASAVYLDIEKPEALAFTGATPDANGCIFITFTTDGPGTYYLQTRQQVRNRWVVMATYELPVQ